MPFQVSIVGTPTSQVSTVTLTGTFGNGTINIVINGVPYQSQLTGTLGQAANDFVANHGVNIAITHGIAVTVDPAPPVNTQVLIFTGPVGVTFSISAVRVPGAPSDYEGVAGTPTTAQDGRGFILSTDCLTAQITDFTDYDTNGESGHNRSDFDQYYKITITRQDMLEHTFSALQHEIDAGAEEIQPPATGGPQYTYTIKNGDGVYEPCIIAVPTWRASANYNAQDDIVYYPGDKKLYLALQDNNNSVPSDSNTDWEEVQESDLPEKYVHCVREIFLCELNDCINKYVEDTFCNIEDNICNDEELLSDKKFLNSLKLYSIRLGLLTVGERRDFEKSKRLIELSKQICRC